MLVRRWRRATLWAALAASGAASTAPTGPLHAQTPGAPPAAAPAAPPATAPAAAPSRRAEVTSAGASKVRFSVSSDTGIKVFLGDSARPRVVLADTVRPGARTVGAAERLAGDVASYRGPLHVYGEIGGDAVAIDGDVVVHGGGVVRGDAVALGGKVRLDGGTVAGEMRALDGAPALLIKTAARAKSDGTAATWRSLQIVAGWLMILLLIGIGVLVFAGSYLDGVSETLERNFMRALGVGIVGQLAFVPALLLLCVTLTLTILGILLVPFAIVAWVLAGAGVLTLGFLALSVVTGRSLLGARTGRLSERGATLRALVVGVTLYLALWIAAAAFAWSPITASILRGLAVAVTWVAATAGFGAAILSRAGTRREVAAPTPVPQVAVHAPAAWETPTPIGGVVAARRPTPAPPVRER